MRPRRAAAGAILLGLLLGLAPTAAPAREAAVIERVTDGLRVAGHARLAAGEHVVVERDGTGVLVVEEDGTVLDLTGATLRGAPADADPSRLAGVGVLVRGARDVTIRGGHVAGFKVGVRAVDAPGLVVEDLDASGCFRQRLGSTPAREDPADWLWPHHNDDGEWEARYGAGISLTGCAGATVRRCRVRRGQNGLLLTRCEGGWVHDNDFSFNSGWGVALYRTTDVEISHNRLDFCVRGYSHGVYHRGQDSAAILLFEQCSRNVIVRNSATHSGDGLFLYAGHETTQRTGAGGSNDNLVAENDFRFAVANGIEATFSEGNVFLRNRCDGCDHGIWAGYSRASTFTDNVADDCLTAGISVEHGNENVYLRNRARGARYGLHLWWDDDRDLLESAYGRAQDCASARNRVAFNTLAGRVAALRLDGDEGSRIEQDRYPAASTRWQLLGDAAPALLAHENVEGALVVENRTGGPLVLGPPVGLAPEAVVVEGDAVTFAPPAEGPTPPPPESALSPPLPPVRGSGDVALPADLPAGRAAMRIDAWGPVDPRRPGLFPATGTATGPTATVEVLGSGRFEVVAVTDGVRVVPREGTAPATLLLEAAPDAPVVLPWRLVVRTAGAEHAATGTLARIPWRVGYFAWDETTHPLERPEAFARLLAGEPLREETLDALDLPWRSGGPAGLPADGFATRAEATLALPAGRWRLRTVSDDGIRVWVDGALVIERWDRHAPTEDVVTLDLPAGEHVIRVHHMELDGWAHLAVDLEPAGAADGDAR